jgi:hypothetical protein
MYWDIEDEQICKRIMKNSVNIDDLIEKHGEMSISTTLEHFTEKGLSIADIFQSYESMPELYLMTTMFDSQRYDIIKEKIMGSKYGFCFDVLFALSKDKKNFQYESEVKTILRFLSGSNKEVDFKHGDKSMFSRIHKIGADKESRKPFTQIWFLPSDNIHEISTCLKKHMKEDALLKKYNVLCINRKNKQLAKDVKEEITKQEKIAISEGKEGLILLAGNMLTLGITLTMCDVVVLMNNALSSDKVLQEMYRITKKNGCICISTDFWPIEEDHSDKYPYGNDNPPMMLFNNASMRDFIEIAKNIGWAVPTFDEIKPFHPRPITWTRMNANYTFAWVFFVK